MTVFLLSTGYYIPQYRNVKKKEKTKSKTSDTSTKLTNVTD